MHDVFMCVHRYIEFNGVHEVFQKSVTCLLARAAAQLPLLFYRLSVDDGPSVVSILCFNRCKQ